MPVAVHSPFQSPSRMHQYPQSPSDYQNMMSGPGQTQNMQSPSMKQSSQTPVWSTGSASRTPLTSRESRRENVPYTGPGAPNTPHASSPMHPRTLYSPQPGSSPQSINQQPSSPQRMDSTYVRQPQSSSSPGSGPQQQSTSSGSGVADQECIEHAARTMDRLMNRDLQFPSLYKSLTQLSDPNVVVTGTRPVSGFMDYDYPPFAHRNTMPESQFTVIHNTPIPTELNEMLNQADVQFCHMGLFPEIYRAWMTIDSDLYLWDFRDGSDLSFYDGLREPIITMALVHAKSNVFQSSIKHLLCVTTASEIVILGFVLTDPNESISPGRPAIELVPQPIFIVPTEGTIFCVIHGTKKGRIFLGGKDGSIHEINYQSGRGWLTDRCWKTNLTRSYISNIFKFITSSTNSDAILQIEADNVRDMLYTRSQSGLLQAFDLGTDGNGFTKVGSIALEGLVNEVVMISKKTLESNVVKKILTIAAVTNGEINLVAVLDNGTRLYFSCYNPPHQFIRHPTVLQLVHVRMPPGYCTSTVMQKPTISHTAFITTGLFALAAKTAHDHDSFWLMSPFIYPTNCFSEIFTIEKLPGQTLDIKSIPGPPDEQLESRLESFPDIITQHLNWQRDIVVLTANGTCVFRANKPFELLKSLLVERGGPENIRNHFEIGVAREQPLSNTALLAIHPSTRSEPSVHDMAVKAFFMYGNTDGCTNRGFEQQPQRINSPFDNTMDFNPNLVSTPRQDGAGIPPNPYLSPSSAETSGYISPTLAGAGPFVGQQGQNPYSPQSSSSQYSSADQLTYSARHDAIYLVVGRILYHFWNRQLVNTGTVSGPGGGQIMTPNILGAEVTRAITFLHSMIVFINSNPSLYMSRVNLNTAMLNINTNEGRRLYLQEMEKNSIIALKTFLSLALEVLNMWKILCDHQFHIVLHGVDTQLQNTTMRDLVITGHSTVSVIINALISKYLGDNAAVDAISLRLREVCPTLFKSEDAIGSKVAEILSKVKNSTDSHDKEQLLKESLMLSEKICGHGRVNVRNLCKQYADLGFPVGAVRLCVSAAKAADPDLLALSTVKTISTSSDPIGMQAFQTRAEIYRIVFDVLDGYVQLASSNQSPVLRNIEERISPQIAQRRAEETIHAVLTSDDEMFHISLYNWLLEKKQFDRLLEIKHPFLDSFLQRAADAVVSGKWPGGGVSGNDTRVLDLLWRHHEMNQNHAAAAQILSKLSESTTTGLNLQQRLEYMSRAIICSKSSSRRGDLLETLEDKVEVAQIQKNILDAVTARIANLASIPTSEEDISAELKMLQDTIPKLNSQLLTITQLYTEFAHPLKLNDAKLEIFYAAGHGDKGTIEAVWSDIIEEELAISARRSMESQMEIIRRKLVTLGRKYINSPTFFPVEFLIEHLESMKPQDTENVSWVFKTMLEVGVTFPDVLLIYERLWRKLLSRQGPASGDIQIAKVIMYMIDSLSKEELDVRTNFINRPDLLEKCKNFIATMIIEYSSRFDTPATQMSQLLNHVKDRLERINV